MEVNDETPSKLDWPTQRLDSANRHCVPSRSRRWLSLPPRVVPLDVPRRPRNVGEEIKACLRVRDRRPPGAVVFFDDSTLGRSIVAHRQAEGCADTRHRIERAAAVRACTRHGRPVRRDRLREAGRARESPRGTRQQSRRRGSGDPTSALAPLCFSTETSTSPCPEESPSSSNDDNPKVRPCRSLRGGVVPYSHPEKRTGRQPTIVPQFDRGGCAVALPDGGRIWRIVVRFDPAVTDQTGWHATRDPPGFMAAERVGTPPLVIVDRPLTTGCIG